MEERILIIDDDVKLCTMLGEYLRSHGFRVEMEQTAASGLEAFRQGRFAALVLDVMLPDGDGFALCRQIRAESEIPIVMLTARGEATDRIVGLELGADDYLPKPFNPRELAARLGAVLRRASGRKSEARGALLFGELEIDPASRQVLLGGRRCELTGYQFDLLWALAENAGRVMSRDALLLRLKGHDMEAFDRSIDVHISRIRSLIEIDPRKPKRILTIRGVGYLFSRRVAG